MKCKKCGKEFSNAKQIAKGAGVGAGIGATLTTVGAAIGITIATGGLGAAAIPLIAGSAGVSGAGLGAFGGSLANKTCPHCQHLNK